MVYAIVPCDSNPAAIFPIIEIAGKCAPDFVEPDQTYAQETS